MNTNFIVLIVDRNKNIRDFLRREFSAEGYRVKEAVNEHQVLVALGGDPQPDILICELDMPVDCALSLLEKIRRMELPMPVIIYTSLTDYEEAPICGWADAFIEKCEDPTLLKNTVTDLLCRKYPNRFNCFN